MADPKAQTIQQRFGFVDADLKSPNHDVIMTWLDANAETIFMNTGVYKEDWDAGDYFISKMLQEIAELLPDWKYTIPKKPKFEMIRRWEYAITSGKFIIGFVDMVMMSKSVELTTNVHRGGGYYKAEDSPCLDVYVSRDYDGPAVCFEVKTSIPSLGEIIRQIRMYQEYTKSEFYVVAPDSRFAGQLHGQGIGFVKYPEGTVWKI